MQMLSILQASKRANVSWVTVRNAVRNGELITNRQCEISSTVIDDWIEKRTIARIKRTYGVNEEEARGIYERLDKDASETIKSVVTKHFVTSPGRTLKRGSK